MNREELKNGSKMNIAGTFGISVIVNDRMCIDKVYVQFKFPKQRSHRRRKKWAKNHKNWRLEDRHKSITVGDKIYVSSEMFKDLQKLKTH